MQSTHTPCRTHQTTPGEKRKDTKPNQHSSPWQDRQNTKQNHQDKKRQTPQTRTPRGIRKKQTEENTKQDITSFSEDLNREMEVTSTEFRELCQEYLKNKQDIPFAGEVIKTLQRQDEECIRISKELEISRRANANPDSKAQNRAVTTKGNKIGFFLKQGILRVTPSLQKLGKSKIALPPRNDRVYIPRSLRQHLISVFHRSPLGTPRSIGHEENDGETLLLARHVPGHRRRNTRMLGLSQKQNHDTTKSRKQLEISTSKVAVSYFSGLLRTTKRRRKWKHLRTSDRMQLNQMVPLNTHGGKL